jgi:hypothetical protein
LASLRASQAADRSRFRPSAAAFGGVGLLDQAIVFRGAAPDGCESRRQIRTGRSATTIFPRDVSSGVTFASLEKSWC